MSLESTFLEQNVGRCVHIMQFDGSAKGQTALVWRAGLTMAFATKLQLHIGGIPPQQVIKPSAQGDFPLSREDMEWQLELFESLAR